MFTEPLAFRMRPRHIDEVVGQKHVIGPTTANYKMIQNGHVPSLLLYGEPGIGKTSIAKAIAGTVDRPFFSLNAVVHGKKDIEEIVKKAEALKEEGKTGVVLFVDEVHRWTKTQADALLPYTESGLITLVSSTTGNPFHDVIPALRSRSSKIVELRRLEPEDILIVLERAIEDKERGLGSFNVIIKKDALNYIASSTNGEVRSALNILEMACMATLADEAGVRNIEMGTVIDCSQNQGFSHDRGGDQHYNTLSAMQKSIRGSDTDAALHYAARLVEAGDLKSLTRRLTIIAYEEIGAVDPQLCILAETTAQACERVGFPECIGMLSVLIVSLCNSPKSKSSWSALGNALSDIHNGEIGEIPPHLKDTHYKSASKLGNGVAYEYPHNYALNNFGSWYPQQYLPDRLKHKQYYLPHSQVRVGKEKYIAEIYERMKKAQRGELPFELL